MISVVKPARWPCMSVVLVCITAACVDSTPGGAGQPGVSGPVPRPEFELDAGAFTFEGKLGPFSPELRFEEVAEWTRYWKTNLEVLMGGQFQPSNPGSAYPVIVAWKDEKAVAGVYADAVVQLPRWISRPWIW